MDSIGYENDKCHFKFPGCKKTHAGYWRAEDHKPQGPFFDACINCVAVPYPQPEHLKKKEE